MKKIKIGVVPYMNAKPLIYGLENNKVVELHFDVPALLTEMLSREMVDVALVPSVEYFRDGNLRIIPNIAIASKGEVKSVKLLVRNHPIKKVALDIASNTSCILSRIVISESYRLAPALIPWNPSKERLDSQADAFLVIGDNALKTNSKSLFTIDLGKEWQELTHQPFVYAFWATKRKTKITGIRDILQEAKAKGLGKLEELSAVEAKRLGLTFDECFNYLSKNICYALGEEEIAGLKTFYGYATKIGLVKEGIDIEFYNA
ncbi:MAG TPA: menaquinone biosynthetic enzyme MqnA/MqnD family protein [Candidatus Brocadiia bacterium]|nr:menaquinone biosynthesis protein [Planctomycetota bacterium]MDO8092262.1 menaquinone biosynthesis protein [Candidatus Brocadiales bacterium]